MSESIVCNRCTFWIKEISRAVRVLPQSVLVHLLHEASFIFCFKLNSNTEFISFSVFFILFLSCQRVNTWFSCTTCRAVTLTQISLWRFLWTPLHHCVALQCSFYLNHSHFPHFVWKHYLSLKMNLRHWRSWFQITVGVLYFLSVGFYIFMIFLARLIREKASYELLFSRSARFIWYAALSYLKTNV